MKMFTRISTAVLISALPLSSIVTTVHGAFSTVPLLVSPADGASLDTICPLFTWNCQSDPTATNSFMEVADNYDFSSVKQNVYTTAHEGETSYRFFDNLTKSTTYYWRARLHFVSGHGDWSEIWSFKTPSSVTAPAAPIISSPPDGATLPLLSNSTAVEWGAVTGATAYLLYRRNTDGSGAYVYDTSDTHYSLSNLKLDQTYLCKVRARTDSAWSAYSPSRSLRQSLSIPSGDYNGDGGSDVAIYRASSGLWAIRHLTRFYFGSDQDLPVSGDYNGDGTTQAAIFRPSTGLWAVRNWSRFYFGTSSDLPAPADYNGDGNCNAGLFRGSSGLWAIRGVTRLYFGTYGDTPGPVDLEGNGTAAIGIFRGSSGLWAYRGISRSYFGTAGDWPVSASYDFGGAIPTIFRESSGLWASINGSRWYYGKPGDIPVPGDYNDSDKDTGAIFRPYSGLWSVRGVTRVYFGTDGDLPVSR